MKCAALAAPAYSIGGTISGLAGSLVLKNNDADTLSLSANGGFTFPTKLASGASYNVAVATQPSGQSCVVANNAGTIGGGDVTNVAVNCSANISGKPPSKNSSGGGGGAASPFLLALLILTLANRRMQGRRSVAP